MIIRTKLATEEQKKLILEGRAFFLYLAKTRRFNYRYRYQTPFLLARSFAEYSSAANHLPLKEINEEIFKDFPAILEPLSKLTDNSIMKDALGHQT